jgi:hypothetical protein
VRAAFDLGSGGIKVVVAEVAPLFDGAGAAGRVRVTQVRCVAGGLGTCTRLQRCMYRVHHRLAPTTQWPVHGVSFWSCSVEQLGHVHAFATLDGVIPQHHMHVSSRAKLQHLVIIVVNTQFCAASNAIVSFVCTAVAVARGTTYTPRAHFNNARTICHSTTPLIHSDSF